MNTNIFREQKNLEIDTYGLFSLKMCFIASEDGQMGSVHKSKWFLYALKVSNFKFLLSYNLSLQMLKCN